MGGPGGSDSGGSCSLGEEPGALFTAASVFCPKLTFSFVKAEIPCSATFVFPACPAGVYRW